MTTHRVFETLTVFLKMGLTSFGGPMAHIGYFRNEFVTRRNWLSEERFAQLLAICQFLPGPASSQLGFAIGLQRAGTFGAIAAFLAFTLPSLFLLLVFARFSDYFDTASGQAIIAGLKLVAVVIVADAILGMSKKFCTDAFGKTVALAGAALLVISSSALLHVGVIVLAFITGSFWQTNRLTGSQAKSSFALRPGKQTLIFLGIFLLFFSLLPLLASYFPLAAIANQFYQAGALVFGGGHVVLPLLETSVVDSGLISKDLFMAGYGAAQAVPGPLFTFAGYLGYNIQAGFDPWLLASVSTVFIFLPGFLLLIATLPIWQTISHNSHLAGGLAGANSAVVGLLGAAFYDPVITTGINSAEDLAIALVGFAMIIAWKKSPLAVVAWCVIAKLIALTLAY